MLRLYFLHNMILVGSLYLVIMSGDAIIANRILLGVVMMCVVCECVYRMMMCVCMYGDS